MKRILRIGEGYALTNHKRKQYTIRYISLLAVLTSMCLYAVKQASAQQAEPAATAVVDTTASVRDTLAIEEVEISTGYQRIPKERVTGSFVLIDSATFHRSVSPNILERLDGVTSGLIMNKGQAIGENSSLLNIRGRSTIFANPNPLVVIDGFPFEGDISQVNAADVASITILRDAAAASIWGTRSGNGVIVITTKSGRRNQPVRFQAGVTTSIAGKPDLHYQEQLNAREYLELEQYLFDQGYFNSAINSDYRPVSEGVAVMAQLRDGAITTAQAEALLDKFTANDVRTEMEKLFYRPQVTQQYNLQLSGGGSKNTFYLSGSYNRLAAHSRGTKDFRGTVTAKQTLRLLNDRLAVSTLFDYAHTINRFGGAASNYRPLTPYDRLMDENGNALPVVGELKLDYVDTAGGGNFLDWHYRPFDEIDPDYTQHHGQTKLQLSTKLAILPSLDLTGAYQYLIGATESERLSGEDRYYTRNFVNQFSYFEGDKVIRPVPEGTIAEQRNQRLDAHTFRLQLQLDKTIEEVHQVNVLMGYEGSDTRSNSSGQTLYGYDPITKVHANATINPFQEYQYYYSSASRRIPIVPNASEQVNITRSYYGNIAYTLNKKYDASASFRRDESNLFGVKSNQRGVPLWSVGVAWRLDKEDFFHSDWLPNLKLRLTYGYNGNVDKSLSAYLTMRILDNATSLWAGPYGEIRNAPNPSLRWEKIQTWNAGIDFSLAGQVISGSIDVYRKRGVDLIGNSPSAPQTGLIAFKGNNSNTETDGMDILINSLNIDKSLKWHTNLLFSYSREKVTRYAANQGRNLDILQNNFSNPLEGYPYFALFSLPSAGLNELGDPQGYLNGEVSTDYSAIYRQIDPEMLIFHGSTAPTVFGNVRNTFSYRRIEFSFNVAYKLGYYFRRGGVFNGSEYGYNYAGYADRWQQPGDETRTFNPALRYPANAGRATFFKYSEHLVYRADHIRLHDIRLAWNLQPGFLRRTGINMAQLYVYVNQLGILWASNRIGVDPDFPSAAYRQPVQFSFGLNLNL